MVGDDAFRIAGRARRVRDRDRVPLVGRAAERRQRRMGGEQRFVLVRAEPVAGARVFAVADVDDDRPAPVRLGQDAQRRADRRRELAVGDQHLALAVVELPGDERGVEAGVERVEDRVQGRHRVVRLDHLGRVVKHRADGRAASDAERAQRRRQPRRAIARLAPGVAALPVDDGLEVAEDLGAALDEAGRRERDEVRCGLVQSLLVDVHGRSPVSGAIVTPTGPSRSTEKREALGRRCRLPWHSRRRAHLRCNRSSDGRDSDGSASRRILGCVRSGAAHAHRRSTAPCRGPRRRARLRARTQRQGRRTSHPHAGGDRRRALRPGAAAGRHGRRRHEPRHPGHRHRRRLPGRRRDHQAWVGTERPRPDDGRRRLDDRCDRHRVRAGARGDRGAQHGARARGAGRRAASGRQEDDARPDDDKASGNENRNS